MIYPNNSIYQFLLIRFNEITFMPYFKIQYKLTGSTNLHRFKAIIPNSINKYFTH